MTINYYIEMGLCLSVSCSRKLLDVKYLDSWMCIFQIHGWFIQTWNMPTYTIYPNWPCISLYLLDESQYQSHFLRGYPVPPLFQVSITCSTKKNTLLRLPPCLKHNHLTQNFLAGDCPKKINAFSQVIQNPYRIHHCTLG